MTANESITHAEPTGHDEAVEVALTAHMWDASDESLCSCGWSPDDYFAADAESDRKYVRDELVNAEEGDEPDLWAPVIAEFVAHQRAHILAALPLPGTNHLTSLGVALVADAVTAHVAAAVDVAVAAERDRIRRAIKSAGDRHTTAAREDHGPIVAAAVRSAFDAAAIVALTPDESPDDLTTDGDES